MQGRTPQTKFLCYYLLMIINKKIILSLALVVSVGVATFFFLKYTQPKQYKLVEIELTCNADFCPGNGTAKVYDGVNSKEECQRIGGNPIVYFGIGGNELYHACGQK